MIVKICSGGKSYKGLSDYLTHDVKATTQDRVAWTHTHNLANDHIPSAVDEMYWTAQNAELLKKEAGVRAGGRQTEQTVKHISLSWAIEDKPTPEHMIETSQQFLHKMGWHDHQAVFVAHNDKPYEHVHIMLSTLHPETGLRLNDDNERYNAQEWALEYERENGRIHCEQRLKSASEREDAIPRNIWMSFQEQKQKFEEHEKLNAEIPINSENESKNHQDNDWKILKQIQMGERLAHFASGKSEFSELRASVYREVRDEFRERWADYYITKKEGGEANKLAELKSQLVAEQKAALDPRRDEACAELRAARDERYRGILDSQAEQRADLLWRQEMKLDTGPLLEGMMRGQDRQAEISTGFRDAALETTMASPEREAVSDQRDLPDPEPSGDFSSRGIDFDIGGRVAAGAVCFLDSLIFDLGTLGSPPPARSSDADAAGRPRFEIAAEEATKQQQHHAREEEDAEWRQRSKALYGE